jgi:hypothetical protein
MHLHHSILKTLAYFDIFDYPLSSEEIVFFLDNDVSTPSVEAALDLLVLEQRVFRIGQFYSLQDKPSLAQRRLKGNQYAQQLLSIGRRISGRLFQFPFVRGIGISGSLSKNFADEKADIDYFVITHPNRLWIARTAMHLYKKWSYLTGRQDWFCMNYFIDEEALEIREKNIFTAMELITLLPISGNGSLTAFFDANDWVSEWLPQYRNRTRTTQGQWHSSRLKSCMEWLLDNKFGDWVDDRLHKLTTRRWQRKEAQGLRNAKGFPMSLQTDKHYSRPNPGMLQKRILTTYTSKLMDIDVTPSFPN